MYSLITNLFSLSMASVAKSTITPCNSSSLPITHWRTMLCRDLGERSLCSLVSLMSDLNGLVGAILVDFPLIVQWGAAATYCSALNTNRWQNKVKPRAKFPDPAASCLVDHCLVGGAMSIGRTRFGTQTCRDPRKLPLPLQKACLDYAAHKDNKDLILKKIKPVGGIEAVVSKFKATGIQNKRGSNVAAPMPTVESSGIVDVAHNAKARIVSEVRRKETKRTECLTVTALPCKITMVGRCYGVSVASLAPPPHILSYGCISHVHPPRYACTRTNALACLPPVEAHPIRVAGDRSRAGIRCVRYDALRSGK